MSIEIKKELVKEIKYGLPSARMCEAPNIIVFHNNNEDGFIVVKSRFNRKDAEYLIENGDWITYDKKQELSYHYNELLGKNVIADRKLLSKRGLLALNILIEMDFS